MLSKPFQEFVNRLIKMSEKVFRAANIRMLLVKMGMQALPTGRRFGLSDAYIGCKL